MQPERSGNAVVTEVMNDQDPGATAGLAAWIVGGVSLPLPAATITWAKHALLDWFGVAIGGSREPLVEILVAEALDEGALGESRLLGRTERMTLAQAALINGAASHALDFDDFHPRMYGHVSVAVAPAVLALAERNRNSGRETIEAFVVGFEVACRIGDMIGPSHDEKGWHPTATIGTFGAAAAAAKLLSLDTEQTAMALGLAATQASGLQCMFGTMGKPLHAGRAAMNGLLAARWAVRGFTSNSRALEGHQGFAATQSSTFDVKRWLGVGDRFGVEANLFKYHAACYLTHAAIEATRALRDEHRLVADDVKRIRLRIPRLHLEACNIPDPSTGLQVKFSITHVIAMTIAGLDTGDPDVYTLAAATRDDLVAMRNRIQLEPEEWDAGSFVSEIIVELGNGQALSKYVDVGIPADDIEQQWQRLQGKFCRLAEPVVGRASAERMISLLAELDELEGLSPLLELGARDSR